MSVLAVKATAKPSLLSRARRQSGHAVVGGAVLLLAIPAVPHELIRSGPSLAFITLVLAFSGAFTYRRATGAPGQVELMGAALAAWIVFRLLLIGSFDNNAPPWPLGLALAEIAPIVTGIFVYRLARLEELRPTICRWLAVGLVIALAIEIYQRNVGLSRLLNLGYESPVFNYAKADGTYRPFGTYRSPVDFGAYLALAGAAVSLTVSRRMKPLALIAVAYGLILTSTRGAWVACLLALIALAGARSGHSRERVVFIGAVGALVLALVAVINPAPFRGPLDRLNTIDDPRYESNAKRVQLWSGVIRAFTNAPLHGYGAKPFKEELSPYVGYVAQLSHAHNNFFQLLYLYGLFGVALFIAVIAALFRQMRFSNYNREQLPWRSVGIATVVIFVITSMTEATWGSFALIVLVFLLAGLGSPAYPRKEPELD